MACAHIYGSSAPSASAQEYDDCCIKFEVYLKSEKELGEKSGDESFQAYSWDGSNHTISYRRTFFGTFPIGYDITVTDGKVIAYIGKNYYKLVQKRVMNLHGIYYLLSDLANIVLLKKGYLTLYASGAYCASSKNGVLCFAPPNTGKTLTATELCSKYNFDLVGEDIVIAKGDRLYSCPWTASYRGKKSVSDSAGSMARTNSAGTYNRCNSCEITHMTVLAMGDERIVDNRDECSYRISILNGYLFGHYSSPIVKILGYFDSEYRMDWTSLSQKQLELMICRNNCKIIYSKDPMRYCEIINDIVGEEK